MEKEEAAAALHGNQYAREGSRELFAAMKEAGLVAVFGASDDLTEFRGAIHDETGAYNSAEHRLTRKGLLTSKCDGGEDCPYFRDIIDNVKPQVTAHWCPEGQQLSWLIETHLPHAAFEIVEA
jgi:hypothetical protein